MGLTAVSGLVFMICQSIWLHRNGTQGIHYAVIAGIAGTIGLSAITFPKLQAFFCAYLGQSLSSWFNDQFWWFVMSDVSVWCLLQDRKSVV